MINSIKLSREKINSHLKNQQQTIDDELSRVKWKSYSPICHKTKNHHRSGSSDESTSLLSRTANIDSQNIIVEKDTKDQTPQPFSNMLTKCNKVMVKLFERRDELFSGDLFNTHPSNENDTSKSHEQFYDDTMVLMGAIQGLFDKGTLLPSSSKEIQELTRLLGNCLILCSELIQPDSHYIDDFTRDIPSPGHYCMQIIGILMELNIDVQPIHYQHTIKTLVKEERWQDASRLFLQQTDPDAAGLTPLDATLDGGDGVVEMGLYAVAQNMYKDKLLKSEGDDDNARQIDLAVAEKVFDVVLHMCMISPTDQEQYVLAAGIGLGKAGRWRGCLEYMNLSDNITKLGKPLVAATMLSCIESKAYDQALDIYFAILDDSSIVSEWQWRGEYGAVHPLLNDLALRAFAMASSDIYTADDAYQIFKRTVLDRGTVSVEGLQALLSTMERDGDYRTAVAILHELLSYKNDEKIWKIIDSSNCDVLLERPNGTQRALVRDDVINRKGGVIDGNMLGSILNSCNAAGQHGMGILCCLLAINAEKADANSYNEDRTQMVNHLLLHLPLLRNENFLKAAMTSCCGLGCYHDAVLLYSEINDIAAEIAMQEGTEEEYHHTDNLSNSNNLNSSTDYFNFAKSKCVNGTTNLEWQEAYKQITDTVIAINSLKDTKHKLSEKQEDYLTRGIAKVMQSCSALGQHAIGLHLAQIATTILPDRDINPVTEVFTSFFEGHESNRNEFETWDFPSLLSSRLVYSSDDILAAAMNAVKYSFGSDDALQLYYMKWSIDSKYNSTTSPDQNLCDANSQWNDSNDIALDLLIEKDMIDDADALFNSISVLNRSCIAYSTMAQGYARHERMEDMRKLYQEAKKGGCNSEKLALLMMEGVAKSSMAQGKILSLRKFISDIVSLNGEKESSWIRRNYWRLKDVVGFHYARLLIRWNNPQQTQMKELELALSQLKESQRRGNQIDENILRCIVGLSGHDLRPFVDKSNDITFQERINDAIRNIFTAVNVADEMPLGDNSTFMFEVTQSLRKLGAKKESLEYVLCKLEDGAFLNRTTLLHAYEVAESENNIEAISMLESLLVGD